MLHSSKDSVGKDIWTLALEERDSKEAGTVRGKLAVLERLLCHEQCLVCV